jgi:hypothetical protein
MSSIFQVENKKLPPLSTNKRKSSIGRKENEKK